MKRSRNITVVCACILFVAAATISLATGQRFDDDYNVPTMLLIAGTLLIVTGWV